MIDKTRQAQVEDDEDDLPENEHPEDNKASVEEKPEAQVEEPETEDQEEGRDALREQRRTEKKAQKERQRAARARKDHEIQQLKTLVANLSTQVKDLRTKAHTDTASDVDAAIAGAKATVEKARRDIAAATEKQDGAAVAQASDDLADAKMAIVRLEGYKQSLSTRRTTEDTRETTESREERQRPDSRQPDATVMNNVAVFRGRHAWWDPNGGDEDSKAVMQIDQAVQDDGFDPRTREYWMEVESRMKDEIPHRFQNGTQKPKPRPITGGSRDGGGRPEGKSPVFDGEIGRARKEALQEAGMWDDPKKRAKLVKAYVQVDKERAR